MEVLGGSLVLANSLVPGEQEDSRALGVADGEETDACIVAGCSSEMDVWALTSVAPPGSNGVLLEMVIQGVEKQAKVADYMPLCIAIELIGKPESSLGGNGVPSGPAPTTLPDEYLSSFCCTEPFPLLDAPIRVQLEGDSTCVGRHSGRLEKRTRIAASRLQSMLSIGWRSLSEICQRKRPQRKVLRKRCKLK
jgi:hypothetical protein